MSEDVIKKVEALLFAVGRAISIEELSQLTHESQNDVKHALHELKKQYEERSSPLLVFEEENAWKLTVHEKFMSVVQQINPHTELSKAILETLAVIAWKQPSKQSDVIKIRTNKAYEHIDELEKMGFISKEKYGRTHLLKVTGKFFDYFDLPGEKAIREVFKDVKDVEEAQTKLLDTETEKELGLEVFESSEKEKLHVPKEHLGGLEVFEDVESSDEEGQETFESSSEEVSEEKGVISEDEKADKMIKSLAEDSVEDFIQENKAPQEVEETVEEETEEVNERELSPELEEFIKDKKKKE